LRTHRPSATDRLTGRAVPTATRPARVEPSGPERLGSQVSPTRLPRLLGTLVMAFAPYEPLPMLGAARLLSGMAIELVYRWASGQLLADRNNKAVLLYSRTTRREDGAQLCREIFGVVCATVVGIVVVSFNNTVLLLPLGAILVASGVAARWVTDIVLGIIGARLIVIGWRATCAYRSERLLAARLPCASGLRWRIDFLAAVPVRTGHGGPLLAAFLCEADARSAEVVLHCEARNIGFYRKHGFRLLPTQCPGTQHLMARSPGGGRRTKTRRKRRP
jgi:hypothetical protein